MLFRSVGGDLLGDAGSGCTEDGVACEDGGVCAGGVCCDASLACGASCCGATEVCSFLQCVTPGVTCFDETECPDGYYCEYALGEVSDAGAVDASCVGGTAQVTGKCLPKPPDCAPGFVPQPGDPLTCLPDCEYKPPSGQFNPVLKY